MSAQGDDAGEMRMPSAGVQRHSVAEQALVVPVKGSDSSYLEMAVPCGVHKCSSEFAAVRLLCELLSRSEGPMWERIRGRGLAYHAGLDVAPWSGQVIFSLAECADPAAATEEMFAILRECREQLSAPDAGSNSALAAALSEARASTLFSLHSKRATPAAAASTAARGYWWGIAEPSTEAEQEALMIEAVDVSALLQAFDRHVAPLLEPGVRCTCVATPAGKEHDICASLNTVLGLKGADAACVAALQQLLVPTDSTD